MKNKKLFNLLVTLILLLIVIVCNKKKITDEILNENC